MDNDKEVDDLRSQLEAEYDASSETTQDAAPATEAAEVSAETGSETTETQRQRDERGRFAAKQAQEAASTEGQSTDPQTAAPLVAPWDWDKEAKADFAKLPPEAQAIVARRYSEQQQFFQNQKAELDRVHQENHDIHSLIDQNRDSWAMRGLDPKRVLAASIAFDRQMLENPREAILQLARSNGVDLSEPYAEQEQQFVDPVVGQLQQELAELRNWRQAQESQSQNYVIQNVTGEIQNFAHETDKAGIPMRPYFQQVYSEMLPIVSAMKQANPHAPSRTILQDAYDRAVWSNPETRAAMLQAEEAKRIDEQTKKAAAARRAGSTLNGAPGPGLRPAMPDDLRGQLEANWDALFS